MFTQLEKAAAYALSKAPQGVDLEFYFSRTRTLRIEVRNLEVESMREAVSFGLGVQAIQAGRVGFAYTSYLGEAEITQAITDALTNSTFTFADPNRRLPKPQGATKLPFPLADPELANVPLKAKIEKARAVEAAARNHDPRVRNVRQGMYADKIADTLIASTQGVYAYYQATNTTTSILVVAEDGGAAQTGWSFSFTRNFADLKDEAVGKEAAARAVALLGARSIPSQRVPVIFDPMVFAELIEVFCPAFTGEAVQKGKSLFTGKLGTKVAAASVNIIDDGTHAQGLASAPVDDEGVPTQKTSLVEDGILKNLLYDTYTAQKDGVTSTGNAVRGTFKALPRVRPTNFLITPGQQSPEQLKNVPKGLYVTNIMGVHTANAVSGDFSVGAMGLWLENGAVVHPVAGITLAGNFLSLLQEIDGIGADLQFFGGIGTPTIRVAAMTVSGEE